MSDDPIRQLEELREAGLALAREMKNADEQSRAAAEGMRLYFEELTGDAAKMEKARQDIALWTEHMAEASDATRNLQRNTERLIRTLTGVEKNADGVISSLIKMTFESGGLADAQTALARTLDETLTMANIATGVTKKFAEGTSVLTLSIDNATTAFAKASGTGTKYKDVIAAAEYQNRHLGVSASEAQAATAALHGGFTEFLLMSKDAQKTLVTTVAEFETFGVAAGTTTKFLEGVTRVAGRTRQQAMRLQKSIMSTAKAFGDDLNKAMENAADIMPKLAIYGQNLEGVFNDLYAASKRTGMGMSEIVAFGEQFDTFESAADAAGQLNAVLGQMGGSPLVDTMQILQTIEKGGPAAAMELFRDSITQSVGSFENLDFWQQKAVARAMGMNVEQTRQMMLQEEQSTAMESALARRGLREDEIIELQKEGRDLMTEMKILAMQFAMNMKAPLGWAKDLVGFLNASLKGLRDMGSALDSLGIGGQIIKGIGMLGVVLGGSGLLLAALVKQSLKGTFFNPMFVRDVSRGVETALIGNTLKGTAAKSTAALGAVAIAVGGIAAGLSKAREAEAAGHHKEAQSTRRGTWGGALIGGILAAVGLGASGITLGTSLGLVGLGAGIATGAVAGATATPAIMGTTGMAEGGVVPAVPGGIPATIGEGRYPELVAPLPPGGIKMEGQEDILKELKSSNDKMGDLINAVKKSRSVLVTDTLRAAGFVNKTDIATGY